MRQNDSVSQWRACLLGAIDGLLFGIVAEVINSTYITYKIENAWRTDPLLDLVDMHDPSFLPIVFTVLFAAVSWLLHHYWHKHPKSLFWLWQIIGLVAVTLFALLDLANRPYFNQHRLLELLMTWVVGLGLAFGINLIFGLLMPLTAAYYSREERINLF
jgi:hypothetical protein